MKTEASLLTARIKVLLPFLLLLTLLRPAGTLAASASTVAEAKNAIQAAYDQEATAASHRDLTSVLSHLAPNFVFLPKNAPKQNLLQMQMDTASLFSRLRSYKSKSVIRKINLHSTVATVLVVEHGDVIVLDPQTGQPNKLVQDDTSLDTWMKIKGIWKETKAKELTVQSTLNGMDIPGR